MRNTISTIALAAGSLFCLVSSGYADTTAPTVTYNLGSQSLVVTPTGATTINVSSGATFLVTGFFSSTDTGINNNAEQTYLAGLSPFSTQVDLFNTRSGFFSGSGNYSADLMAPTTPGTYYIGGGFTYDFQFDPGVAGQANGASEVSYIINVGSVAATPEPSSLILLGSGLVGIGASAFKRRMAWPA